MCNLSNGNYKNLPAGVSCPGGSSAIDPVCMAYDYVWHGNILAWKAYPELVYTVYVFPLEVGRRKVINSLICLRQTLSITLS